MIGLRKNFILIFSSALVLGVGILKRKGVSVIGGIDNLGLLGSYVAFQGLFMSFGLLGMDTAFIREYNLLNNNKRVELKYKFLSLSILLAMFWMMLLIFLSSYVSEFYFGKIVNSKTVIILAVSILAGLNTQSLNSVLNASNRVKDYSLGLILNSMISLGSVLIILCFFPIYGIEYALCATNFLYLGYLYSRVEIRVVWGGLSSWSEELMKGIPFLFNSILQPSILVIIYAFLSKVSTIETLGFFNAIYGLSIIVPSLITSVLKADYYPTMFKNSGNKIAMSNIANNQIFLGLALSTPILLIFVLFTKDLLILFYSRDLQEFDSVLLTGISALSIRVVSWPLGLYMVAKKYDKTYILAETFNVTAIVGLAMLGWMMDGLQGLFTGLVISNILYLSFVYTFAHRHGFRFKVEVLCTFGAVVIVLVSGMLRYNWLSIISVLILLFSFRVRLNSYVQKVYHRWFVLNRSIIYAVLSRLKKVQVLSERPDYEEILISDNKTNPSVLKFKNYEVLSLRKPNYTYSGRRGYSIVDGEENYTEISWNRGQECVAKYIIYDIEDVRLFKIENKCYAYGNLRVEDLTRIVLYELDLHGVEEVGFLESENLKRIEKNWMPLIKDTVTLFDLKWIYDIKDGTYYRNGELFKQKRQNLLRGAWRGGGPSVALSEDRFLLILHKRHYKSHRSYVYWHMLVEVDEEFRVIRRTKPFVFRASTIEFCTSFTYDNSLLVAYIGYEDTSSYECRISVEDLWI